MEYRKLISFGKSSYVISLPKNWVKENKLVKGDLIYLDEQDNNLIVGTKEKSAVEDKTKVIGVDNKSISQLERELHAAYIENYREITFRGSQLKQKSEELLRSIRD